ncbi:bystin-like [Salvia splendens]|uniref:bystin-like n=1 Tax=Salvia splendens TaxID=180675 RepID=UPI001C25DE61|nr:bystin-like [Salvia splendens]
MSKKRPRNTNPEPFLPLGSDAFSTGKKRHRLPKHHQLEDKLVPSTVSSTILKEALLQQKEIQREEESANNVSDHTANSNIVFPQSHGRKEDEYDDDDVDDSKGFFEDDINEEDEKLLEAFLSKDNSLERTVADIVEEITKKDAQVSIGAQPMTKSDDSVIELYKRVGKLLSKYTSGKIPKALKFIPSQPSWEERLYLTEPDKWSLNALYQAIVIFASSMGVNKVAHFYKFVLLPRVKEDIRKNKTLHPALYQSLIKACYKQAAFIKGILIPLCECKETLNAAFGNFSSNMHLSRTCNLREADIIGSIIKKLFITLLIEKKCALTYTALDALVAHFMKFYDESTVMPVIWHQSLLAFAQRYKKWIKKGGQRSSHCTS